MTNNTLINKTRVKRFILICSNDAHPGGGIGDTYTAKDGTTWNWSGANKARQGKKYTQVSQDLLDEIDRSVRKLVDDRVRKTPQTGKTVK